MTTLLYILLYAGGIVFLAGCVVRAVRYARQPIHLRWEIYPVPRGRSGELKIMLPEIFLLKGLWEFNRPMWYRSYPFHLGLYLLIVTAAISAGGALLPAAAGVALHPVAVGLGNIGAVLCLLGAVALFVRRANNAELKRYSTPGDYCNLIFFIATMALLLAGYWLRPAGAAGPSAILRGALRFDAALRVPALFGAGVACGMLLLAYIPMTHMAHFIAKYFTYHQVRWDERANVAGGTIQKQMAEYLMYRPTWAAPHVQANGERSWVDVATTNPAQGGSR